MSRKDLSAPLPAALTKFDELPDSALVRLQTVAALEDVSMSTLWRRIASGTLPTPLKVGGVCRMHVGELRAFRRASASVSK